MSRWVLEQDKAHESIGAEAVSSFIANNFWESVSPTWVTHAMKALHLSSHHGKTKPDKYRRPHLAASCHAFLQNLRNTIDTNYEPSRVVAVDNMCFAHPPAILWSFAPQGG